MFFGTKRPPAPLPFASHVCGPALSLLVMGKSGRARALDLLLPHGPLRTPVFMPVGTQATVKGLTTLELAAPPLDCDIILANTYHLGSRPDGRTIAAAGGIHKFMSWPRNVLTDSGGFQMVSLLKLAEINEEGVAFQNPNTGETMNLTPEYSIQLQNQIGADIIMQLDDVVSSTAVSAARFEEACHRSVRWLDRCIAAHTRSDEQSLFGILQGGLDVSPGGLRDVNMRSMLERDKDLPGYAIGGLAGGEEKDMFWRVVDFCCSRLPSHKPRYLMGVGYPLDLVVCTALGVDMYDCVYPTRTARFGTAMLDVPGGLLKLKAAAFKEDRRRLEEGCDCDCCRNYDRAHLHMLLKTEVLGPQLLTLHNLAYMARLTRNMRAAIVAGEYPAFFRNFVERFFGGKREEVPRWVAEAAAAAGIAVFDTWGTGAMDAPWRSPPPPASAGGGGAAPPAPPPPPPKRIRPDA